MIDSLISIIDDFETLELSMQNKLLLAKRFQNYLMVLFLFSIGGQRLEVILNMTVNVISFFLLIPNKFFHKSVKRSGETWSLKIRKEKVTRRACAGGIPIPQFLSCFLEYFLQNFHSILILRWKQTEVEESNAVKAIWINNNGKPMGNIF